MENSSESVEKPVKRELRWYQPTPGRLLLLLLIVQAALFFSESWFPKGWAVLISIAAVALTIVLMLLWFVAALVFHWRFQFSIRSLLLLSIAVAIPFSWLAVRMKEASKQREVIGELIEMGGQVWHQHFDGPFVLAASVRAPHGGTRPLDEAKPWQPRLLDWLDAELGEDFFINLSAVFLRGNDITNSNLKPLCKLKHLKSLDTYQTRITDEGLRHLQGMTKLEVLSLDDSQITDKGLEHLKGLKQLKTLHLERTAVTAAGVADLQKALPNCDIGH